MVREVDSAGEGRSGRGAPRFVYLVLSHRAPAQVARLVAAIRALSPRSRVIVSHDVTGSPVPAVDDPAVEVHRRDRAAPWGAFDVVDAVLGELDALERAGGYDWVVVVSGQDFPLVALDAWEAELAGAGMNGLVREFPMPGRLRWGRRRNGRGRYLTRYEHRQFRVPMRRSGRAPGERRHRGLFRRAAAHLAPVLSYEVLPTGHALLGLRRPRSPFSPSYPCRKASQWLALDRTAVARVLEVDRKGDLRRLYRSALLADESYLQTVVLNDPHLRIRRGSVTEAIFDPPSAPHPLTITAGALPALLARAAATGAAFGRKFDPAEPAAVAKLEVALGIATDPVPGRDPGRAAPPGPDRPVAPAR